MILYLIIDTIDYYVLFFYRTIVLYYYDEETKFSCRQRRDLSHPHAVTTSTFISWRWNIPSPDGPKCF